MEIKSHVRSILVFCAAAFAFTAFAEDGITAEKYPDADTVVVENDVRTVYNAEGTFALEELEVEKALTERGRRKLSTFYTMNNMKQKFAKKPFALCMHIW